MGDEKSPEQVAGELVSQVERADTREDVLQFAGEQMNANRTWLGKSLDTFKDMFKGNPGQLEIASDDASEQEGASSGRGPGYMLKGWACKGSEEDGSCGYRMPMRKSHPHFGKKRQVADELVKGAKCPRCGGSVSPIMDKGDDELPYGDDAPMDKGVEDPRIDEAIQNLLAGSEQILSNAEALVEVKDLLKGLESRIEDQQDQLDAFTDIPEFMSANVDALQDLQASTEEQNEMIKGLQGLPRTEDGGGSAGERQPSLFDAAADAATALPEREMSKGQDASSSGLTDDELDCGVQKGVIRSFDKVRYRAGGSITGFGRDAGAFRKAISK